MVLLRVALPLPLEPMSYLPPLGDGRPEVLGRRVAVPWRGQVRVGLVVGVEDDPPHAYALRHAIGYLDEAPFLDAAGLEFLHQAARYLFAPLGQVLADLVPFLEGALEHRVRLVPGTDPSALPGGLEALTRWQPAHGFDPKLLDLLREGGVLEEEVRERRPTRTVLVPVRKPSPGLSVKARGALEALWALGEAESQAALARIAGVSSSVVRRLVQEGYAAYREVPLELEPPEPPARPIEPLVPPEAPRRVNGGRFEQRLAVLAGLVQEAPALVLFPETHLLKRALAYFPQALPFHGELPPELRRKLWREARDRSVFGTYQALLLPGAFRRVVVVEEASDSYKLTSGSRAHVARLAELRAQGLGVELVYLSMVPAVEALAGPALTLRPPAPRVHAIDLRKERGWPLTGRAVALLKQVAVRGRQAILLSARRGYAAVLRCRACGWNPTCPNCALPLRLHRPGKQGRLVCHQCGHTAPAPPLCPACGAEVFGLSGPGVEWLAEAAVKAVPELAVYQYSRERKDDLTPLLEGRPGVVVGTTAVLRAPVLPELALVLLPYADGFVLEADYRAIERFHQLAWHLADLHPTRRPLLAFQTFEPDHPVLEALREGDLERVPQGELRLRELLGYPPARRMVKLEVSHPKEATARAAAQELAQALTPRARPEEVLGPAPAPVPRVKGRYVFHILLRAESTDRLHALLADLPHPRGARLRLDPDPLGFVGLLED
ncbi:hypothetical protein [Marinithermus hydrothermalis]|uniref:Primosomal protein N n=1 Tax=Marinithermus hydrothermalis (strain DSM 14884 / JCM 11576 / T1) TaxID=869210 RepID=F2NRA4_MARHT|nr:hypothetical protein [Marinithermus hydrothermalis]AEB12953.1 primosomal protein N' [Marinithermus hydrothermalis DSM 14884]